MRAELPCAWLGFQRAPTAISVVLVEVSRAAGYLAGS